MKKFVFVFALIAILATGTVFADYPKGWGIGAQWGGNIDGDGFGHNVALSLKLPSLPIFWAINYGLDDDYLKLGVNGDYYFIHNRIAGPLHWYLGLGGSLIFQNYNKTTKSLLGDIKTERTDFDVGARIPIGLSLQPVNFLEAFLTVAPRLGVHITGKTTTTVGGTNTNEKDGSTDFGWAVPIEVGLRIWL